MSFFDFHTHNKASKEKAIINIFHNEDIIPNKSLSCGIHPWYYNENYKKEINTINNLAKSKQIIAIGETGYDPVSPANIELQKTIFIEHINRYIKRFKILSYRYRNKRRRFSLRASLICAIYNLQHSVN